MEVALSAVVPAVFGEAKNLGILILGEDCLFYRNYGFSYSSLNPRRVFWTFSQSQEAAHQFFSALIGPILANPCDLGAVLNECATKEEDDESKFKLEVSVASLSSIPYQQIAYVRWKRRFLVREAISLQLKDGREISFCPGFFSPWGFITGKGAEKDFRWQLDLKISH